MLRRILQRYSDRFVSKWLILLIDICLTLITFYFAKLIRHNFAISEIDWKYFGVKMFVVTSVYILYFIVFRSFSGIIRHTNISDTVRIFKASTMALLTLVIALLMLNYTFDHRIFLISFSVLLIHYFITLFMLVSLRLMVKAVYYSVFESNPIAKKNVLIYGAGRSGMITYNTLIQDAHLNYNIIGFIDDNATKIGKMVGGVRVYAPEEALNNLVKEKKIEEVIISIQNINSKRKSEIIDQCMALEITVKTIPPIHRWINGELSTGQIKTVNIEDLLNREPIVLDTKNIISQIRGKVVLVTGAAGSIGSEISRQVMAYQPSKIILLDQAETPLYDLEHNLSLLRQQYSPIIKFVMADVQNELSLRRVFIEHKPDFVFHAAAYKHVPLMENNPFEAVRVNILGTKLLADLSVEFGVSKFIMVSTDKAVNPTNVMGASKRVAEIYTQSLNTLPQVTTSFITTRFGNVLGSNGSVIPLFKKQIEKGGPVTVTHPEITRYFMTIPEACQLVLEAGAMGNGGEIFIFDMGESVRIIDVAKNMIKLYGLKLGKDIQIEITGLRPGEKLYEELLNMKENTIPTHHPKIMIAKVVPHSYAEICDALNELQKAYASGTDLDLVSGIKQMVKEYLSNNSVYQILDHGE